MKIYKFICQGNMFAYELKQFSTNIERKFTPASIENKVDNILQSNYKFKFVSKSITPQRN